MNITTSTKGRPRNKGHQDSLNRLREFRLKAGKTQKETAAMLGISQEHLSRAEVTGKRLSEEKWQKAAELFGTDLLTIRGWKKIYRET